MDDRSIPRPRWTVVRSCQTARHHRQLLAQAYQQVFPQARLSLEQKPPMEPAAPIVAGSRNSLVLQSVTAARVAAGA